MADDWGLICPFWIDTDAYSDRDRLMFVCGFEFNTILEHARTRDEKFVTVIHRENESRIRMMCAKLGRKCLIQPCKPKDDPQGTWSSLYIEAR